MAAADTFHFPLTVLMYGFAVAALTALLPIAAGLSKPGRAAQTARFRWSLVLSIFLGLGLLFGDGLLTTIGWDWPWTLGQAALFITGTYLVPCGVQALSLGLFAGRPAVRWILGTSTVVGALVVAITLLVVATSDVGAQIWTGLSVLMTITLLSAAAWMVLVRKGWLKDIGEPPWDMKKARSTFLGRRWLPSKEFPVIIRRGRPRPYLLLLLLLGGIVMAVVLVSIGQWLVPP
jgi:hypothetical protein